MHVVRPPRHFIATGRRRPCGGLELCPVWAGRRAFVRGKGGRTVMECCGIVGGLWSCGLGPVYRDAMLL